MHAVLMESTLVCTLCIWSALYYAHNYYTSVVSNALCAQESALHMHHVHNRVHSICTACTCVYFVCTVCTRVCAACALCV